MVMLEAHAAGLPVVAADTPAARELVHEGIDGLRYDSGDPSALVAVVRRLLSDRQLRLDLSARAGESVRDATWRHATKVLRGHYLAATDKPRPEHRDRPHAETATPPPASAAVA